MNNNWISQVKKEMAVSQLRFEEAMLALSLKEQQIDSSLALTKRQFQKQN